MCQAFFSSHLCPVTALRPCSKFLMVTVMTRERCPARSSSELAARPLVYSRVPRGLTKAKSYLDLRSSGRPAALKGLQGCLCFPTRIWLEPVYSRHTPNNCQRLTPRQLMTYTCQSGMNTPRRSGPRGRKRRTRLTLHAQWTLSRLTRPSPICLGEEEENLAGGVDCVPLCGG